MAQAGRDLEAARANAEASFHEWACFVAHQAAEKAWKPSTSETVAPPSATHWLVLLPGSESGSRSQTS
jgi:HEPN domain-containing protein